jgi:osmotically inducible protein OsmC
MGFSRYASAQWQGDLKTGQGRLSTPQSGLFADQKGTSKNRQIENTHRDMAVRSR